MFVDVACETAIRCTPEEVWDFAADPTHAPRWYRRVINATWQTEPDVRVGGRAAFVARFLGRQLAYTYEIVEAKRPERLVMRTAEGPFPMETTYTFAANGPATRMTLRNRGEPKGFSLLFAPLMKPAMLRAMRHDLATLKGILEAGRAGA